MPEVVLRQTVVAGEEGVVLAQEAAEVGEEGQEEWVVVVEAVVEVVVVTEFDCIEGIHPGVCWETSGQECV